MNRHLPIALLVVLGAIVATGVEAQDKTAAAGAPAVAASTPSTASWRSAFDSYQPFTDEKTLSWRQANDTVQRVGGWRAYAREAAQPASGAASGSKPDGSAGHRAHPMH